jgi:hypothetical protein
MTLRRALLVLVVPAFACLGGCELIAGVRDINEPDGGADADDDGGIPGIDSGDAPVGASDGPGTRQDASLTDSGVGRDAIANADATGDDAVARMDGTVGDEPGAEASPPVDAGKRDAPSDTSTPDASGSPYVLIDDMEGNTGEISAPGSGTGYWFTYGDGTDGGVETPGSSVSPFPDSMITGGRTVPAPFSAISGATSDYAAQVSGSGFAGYAGMGFNFKSITTQTYDASAYIGFVFWGRIGSTTTDGVVRILVPDLNTDPRGSVCTVCYEYLGENLTFTTSWQQFTVLYTDLAQQTPGVPAETTLDAAKLFGVQFQVSTKAPAGEAFDVWVDDLYFIKP